MMAALTMAACAGASAARADNAWPDSYDARLEILALIETLNADLLASRSATDTLTAWCATHHMAPEPKIVAHLDRDVTKPITAEQRQALAIGPDEPVVYRHVELACGPHVLSKADNWYVPARLTPAMNEMLQKTDVPFGRVVRPLGPRRQTLAVKLIWQPLPQGWELQPPMVAAPGKGLAIPAALFEHRAIVYAAAGDPISEVDETYTSDLLDFARGR